MSKKGKEQHSNQAKPLAARGWREKNKVLTVLEEEEEMPTKPSRPKTCNRNVSSMKQALKDVMVKLQR